MSEAVLRAAEKAYRDWLDGGTGDLIEAFSRAVEAGVQIGKQNSLPFVSGLTGRQRDLAIFIETYVASHGVAPSYDEMVSGLGLASKSGINRLLRGLEERGVVDTIPARARAITLIGSARQPERAGA